MRDFQPRVLHCVTCNECRKTVNFVWVEELNAYICNGDPKKKIVGCGHRLDLKEAKERYGRE